MLRPAKHDTTKGGQPAWLLKCRESLGQHLAAIAFTTMVTAFFAFILTAQTITRISPQGPAPQTQPAPTVTAAVQTQAEIAPQPQASQPATLGEATTRPSQPAQKPTTPTTPKPQPAPSVTAPGTTCDQAARNFLRSTYDTAIKAQVNLYVSALRDISVSANGETTKHNAKVAQLTREYVQALGAINCTP